MRPFYQPWYVITSLEEFQHYNLMVHHYMAHMTLWVLCFHYPESSIHFSGGRLVSNEWNVYNSAGFNASGKVQRQGARYLAQGDQSFQEHFMRSIRSKALKKWCIDKVGVRLEVWRGRPIGIADADRQPVRGGNNRLSWRG